MVQANVKLLNKKHYLSVEKPVDFFFLFAIYARQSVGKNAG